MSTSYALDSGTKFRSRYNIGRFTDTTWEIAARLYSDLRKEGWIIGDADILIGSFCIENGYTLVTPNTKHFRHMTALSYADWTQ